MSSRITVPPPREPKITPERARHLALVARTRQERRAAGLHSAEARCGRPLSDGIRQCQSWPLPGLGGCARHLNDEEWQDTMDYPHGYLRDVSSGCVHLTVEQQNERRLWATQPPACHSWPYPRAVPLPDEDPVELLVAWQAGRCAGCGHSFHADALIDHCHETGLVRGLLCSQCNNAEGIAPPRHPRWFRYRTMPPALILGLYLQYGKPVRRRLSEALAEVQGAAVPGG